jgi:hypothetical protein
VFQLESATAPDTLKTSLEAEGTSLLAYDSYFQIFDAGFANRWLSAISRSTASF